MKIFKSKKQSGYTLLFAVLTAALVLGVAAFILGVARKQYILSSTARDSMYSFYSADSGIDCVAKSIFTVFSTSTPSNTLNCANYSQPVAYSEISDPAHPLGRWDTAPIYFAYFTPGNLAKPWGCAKITISQYYSDNGLLNIVVTSRGYNLCINVGGHWVNDTSPRTVERALIWTSH